jgi:hypothetical protein
MAPKVDARAGTSVQKQGYGSIARQTRVGSAKHVAQQLGDKVRCNGMKEHEPCKHQTLEYESFMNHGRTGWQCYKCWGCKSLAQMLDTQRIHVNEELSIFEWQRAQELQNFNTKKEKQYAALLAQQEQVSWAVRASKRHARKC